MNIGGPSETLLGKIAQGHDVQNVGLSYIAGAEKRQSNVDRILKSVLEISKHDAAGATKILAEEANNYPELEKFKGIQFRDETKNNWITASIGNGQTMMINIQTLGKIAQDPANKDKYLKEEAVTLGTPKMEPAKTRTVQRGAEDVTEEFDASTGAWKEIGKGPKWNLKEKDGKEESRTSNMKEWEFNNQQRKAAGQPTLNFEQYMTQKFELNDPFGVKKAVRDKLKNQQGTTGVGIPTQEGSAAVQKNVPGVRGLVEQETAPQGAGQDAQLPITALDALKKSNGQPVTFNNGQVWQWVNGKAKRIR